MNTSLAKKPLRRRFQFRLRTLLAAMVLLCLAMGGWRLYLTYFGRYVEADAATVGQPFTVRGAFTDLLGYESEVFAVEVGKQEAGGKYVIHQGGTGSARRVWLGSYSFQLQLPPIRQAGEYAVELWPLTKAVQRRGRHVPEDSIRAKMIVRPAH